MRENGVIFIFYSCVFIVIIIRLLSPTATNKPLPLFQTWVYPPTPTLLTPPWRDYPQYNSRVYNQPPTHTRLPLTCHSNRSLVETGRRLAHMWSYLTHRRLLIHRRKHDALVVTIVSIVTSLLLPPTPVISPFPHPSLHHRHTPRLQAPMQAPTIDGSMYAHSILSLSFIILRCYFVFWYCYPGTYLRRAGERAFICLWDVAVVGRGWMGGNYKVYRMGIMRPEGCLRVEISPFCSCRIFLTCVKVR